MELSSGSGPPLGVEELVRRCQRGDPVALDQLMQALTPYVGRICGAIALDAADDAMQETMIVVIRKLRRLREPAALRAWVRRIAVREAMRIAGQRSDTPVDPVDLHDISIADHSQAVEIREILRRMPPAQRALLILRHVDGLSEDEVAALLDVPVGTVKSRAHRARAAFRVRWGP